MEEVEVAEAGLVGEEGEPRVLRAVAEGGIGDELGVTVSAVREARRLVLQLDGRHSSLVIVVDTLRIDFRHLHLCLPMLTLMAPYGQKRSRASRMSSSRASGAANDMSS